VGKALKDELNGLRSLRVARFRLTYRIGDEGMSKWSRWVLEKASTRRR
jgi:hypothetical protein